MNAVKLIVYTAVKDSGSLMNVRWDGVRDLNGLSGLKEKENSNSYPSGPKNQLF